MRENISSKITLVVSIVFLAIGLIFSLSSLSEPTINRQQAASNNTLIKYADTPGLVRSTSYTLKVNGEDISVEKFKDVSYARFAMSGSVELTVGTSQAVSNVRISPMRDNIRSTTNGNNITFTLNRPRKLMVILNNLEKFFIFVDPPEVNPPSPNAPNVTLLTKYMQPGDTDQTTQMQQAIDAVSGAGGGILYVPDGKFSTGSFNMKSNVTLYLSSGALIQGPGTPGGYTSCPMTPNTSSNGLVCINGVQNVKIMGRGTIAGQGTVVRQQTQDHIRQINVNKSTNVEIRDIVIRDSAGFNIRVNSSQDVLLKGYKIVNDLTPSNQDGTDPDADSNLVIDDIFEYTSDDAVAVKADSGLSQGYIIKNSVFWTKKSSMKIGTGVANGAQNIWFIHNDVLHGDRVIAVYTASGTADGIHYVDNTSEDVGGDAKQQLIIMDQTGGSIKNVEVIDHVAFSNGPNGSTVTGSNIHFRNLRIGGQLITSGSQGDISGTATFDTGPTVTPIPQDPFPPVGLPTIPPSTSPTSVITRLPASGGTATFPLLLHGIGKGGDNANPSSIGNLTPLHTMRNISVSFITSQGVSLGTRLGSALYSSASGTFAASVPTDGIVSGSYLVKIKSPGFLQKQISGIATITAGSANILSSVTLVAGDVTDDNQLDILDYSALVGCFGSKAATPTCLHKATADVTDDGKIDGVDYNLFLRELSVQKGA